MKEAMRERGRELMRERDALRQHEVARRLDELDREITEIVLALGWRFVSEDAGAGRGQGGNA